LLVIIIFAVRWVVRALKRMFRKIRSWISSAG